MAENSGTGPGAPNSAASAEMSQPVDAQQQDTKDASRASIDRPKRNKPCRFFGTKAGCRAGDACPFVHDASAFQKKGQSSKTKATVTQSEASKPTPSGDGKNQPQRQFSPPKVDSSRVVSKPVPQRQVEDPREFQLGQIRRRFSPKEEVIEDGTGTALTFKMAPSDPDFPFEIEALDCILRVPHAYPSAKPSLRVTNKEMQRGYQLNVENGFTQIAYNSPNATLLGLMNRLDTQLEKLSSGQLADTVKIVRNAGKPETHVAPKPKVLPSPPKTQYQSAPKVQTYTAEEKQKAQLKRQTEIRQLVARLGKMPNFKQSPDGVTFIVPFESPKKKDLPEALRNLNTLRLIVPELYNLQPCRIEFPGIQGEGARNAESSFEERSKQNPEATLMAHINYMTQHIVTMAASKPVKNAEQPAQEVMPQADALPVTTSTSAHTRLPIRTAENEEKTHIQHIPRPPEWGVRADAEEDSSDDGSFTYDSGDDTEDEEEEADSNAVSTLASTPAEKGIMLSFPHLELHSIELLELVSLNVTVKCNRCKEIQDVERSRNNINADVAGMRDVTCKKCANSLAIGYRMDSIHANSTRAGYSDLDGCTVVDMLPSNFMPTCSECSTPFPAPGVVAVRGDSAMAICRECHRKMSFRIQEVKFLLVNQATVRASRAPARKKAKENLGIVTGQELPRRGRCSHYSKSYRWFRFSCCQKVFSCDKCHDEASDHPNEHANRMICGFCSREQNYRPEDCGICHSVSIGKRGHGFWEGGKGTRDPTRMSRKDPRKYKRRPGTKPKS